MVKHKVIAVNAVDYHCGVGIVSTDYWEYGEQYVLWVDMDRGDNKLHKSKIYYYSSGTPYFLAYGRKQNLNNYVLTDRW